MDCTQARDRLSEYQDGGLDAAATTALAAHLRGCGDCAADAEALAAVRERLRALPPSPAPPDLLGRVVAAVEAETPKPFLSRFRIPLEAAAAVLLFASVYWYQRTAPPSAPPAAVPAAQAPAAHAPRAAPGPDVSIDRPVGQDSSSPASVPRPKRKTAKEGAPAAPAAAKLRTWTSADLPSVPALRASSDSERIVPVAPSPGTGAGDVPAAGAPMFETGRRPEAEGSADPRPSRVFAAPPSRLLRPLPYGRDIVMDVKPENREGAEERIAAAALRVGGIVERDGRGPDGAASGSAGIVRVILPDSAATRFLEEVERIGTIPPEGKPTATDLPAGPRAGTVAYAVRIRVR